MKAFQVGSDCEKYERIVFVDSREKAKARGAGELDIEFCEVTCVRRPQFDQYAPGPVPAEVLLAAGWWYECSNCGPGRTTERKVKWEKHFVASLLTQP